MFNLGAVTEVSPDGGDTSCFAVPGMDDVSL